MCAKSPLLHGALHGLQDVELREQWPFDYFIPRLSMLTYFVLPNSKQVSEPNLAIGVNIMLP